MIRCWTRGEYTISTDPGRLDLDLDLIHPFLARSYWAEGRPRERVALSIEGSLRFGFVDPPAGVLLEKIDPDSDRRAT